MLHTNINNEEQSTPAAHAISTDACFSIVADPVAVGPMLPDTLPVSVGLPMGFTLAALLTEPATPAGLVDAGFVFPLPDEVVVAFVLDAGVVEAGCFTGLEEFGFCGVD